MIHSIVLNAMKQEDISKYFRLKKRGRDKNPFFYTFGKIHGLENLAFADPVEVK